MFGIFSLLFGGALVGGSAFVKECRDTIEITACRDAAKVRGDNTYIDNRGVCRSMENVEPCYWERYPLLAKNAHYVLRGSKTGKIYRDRDEEKFQEMNREAKEKGKAYHWVRAIGTAIDGKDMYLRCENDTGRVYTISLTRPMAGTSVTYFKKYFKEGEWKTSYRPTGEYLSIPLSEGDKWY